MRPQYFVGIDISKITLDFAIINKEYIIEQGKIGNNEKEIRALFIRLSKSYKCVPSNSVCCAENMGLYGTFLLNVCAKRKVRICMENTLQIKRSIGLQRVKTDAADALQIARYASKNWQTLRLWKVPETDILELKALSTVRKKLIKVRVAMLSPKKLENYFLTPKEKQKIQLYTQETIKAVSKDLKIVESQLTHTIKRNVKLSNLLEIITSVPFIGEVIGTECIIITNAFQDSWTAKKFSCYCGVAPFERTSGTSIKGKTKVSNLANKSMKSLLHMAALAIVGARKKSFLKSYYERQIQAGKHQMSVLNAIKNKLIHRIFSCVRSNKPYAELNPG